MKPISTKIVIIIFCVFFHGILHIKAAHSEDNECIYLQFTDDIEKNREKKYIKKTQILKKNPTEGGEYYISLFDLNDDGNLELFYFIDSWNCGTSNVCPFYIFEYKNGKLIEIFQKGYYKYDIKLLNNEQKKHICVTHEKFNGWKKLRMEGEYREGYVSEYGYIDDNDKYILISRKLKQ